MGAIRTTVPPTEEEKFLADKLGDTRCRSLGRTFVAGACHEAAFDLDPREDTWRTGLRTPRVDARARYDNRISDSPLCDVIARATYQRVVSSRVFWDRERGSVLPLRKETPHPPCDKLLFIPRENVLLCNLSIAPGVWTFHVFNLRAAFTCQQ